MEKVQNPEAITLRCSYKRRGEPSNSLLRARTLIRIGLFLLKYLVPYHYYYFLAPIFNIHLFCLDK